MQRQLDHTEFKNNQEHRSNNIITVLENLDHFENIGSAFRLADAFNINGIIIITKNELDWKKISKTARNCQTYIPYTIYNNVNDALLFLKQNSYMPINIEITSTSKPLRDVNFSKYGKVALIVGNEKSGISVEMLNKVPTSCHIEMYDNNSSMNVSTALAIALYKSSEDFSHKIKKE